MNSKKENENHTEHQWEQISTGDEGWDFSITTCKRCGKDWRMSEKKCIGRKKRD